MEVKEPAMEYGWSSNSLNSGQGMAVRRVTISVPTADLQLFKELVNKMGWTMHHEEGLSKVAVKKQRMEALKRLRGCITLPADYDYTEDIVEAFRAKYENL